MNNETHQFQVSVWSSGNGKSESVFQYGYWKEMARCISPRSADKIAISLSAIYPQGVQLAKLVNDEQGARFVGYKFIPESARNLKSEQEI